MKYLVKNFCLRGLIFSGFGPIIYAIVMLSLYLANVDTMVDGLVIFKGVISTYLMAFIIAGSSIIWQIEKLGLAISIPTHGGILYVCYILTYIINGWIKTDLIDIAIFTLIFIVGYLLIWAIIYFIEKNRAKRLNKKLQ